MYVVKNSFVERSPLNNRSKILLLLLAFRSGHIDKYLETRFGLVEKMSDLGETILGDLLLPRRMIAFAKNIALQKIKLYLN